MRRPDVGRYAISLAGNEEVRAFVPAPLPPTAALELIGPVRNMLDQALLALYFSLPIAAHKRPRRISSLTKLDWRHSSR
jgi:hypothetical protein